MTTATTWRKERGRETERLVASYLQAHGWQFAEAVGAGRPGADITGTPGLSIEVKATKTWAPASWLQAARRRMGLPLAVWRPDGLGPERIHRWLVVFELEDAVKLLRAAGYGGEQ